MIMQLKEFIDLTGYEVSAEIYRDTIKPAYLNSSLDKDAFCHEFVCKQMNGDILAVKRLTVRVARGEWLSPEELDELTQSTKRLAVYAEKLATLHNYVYGYGRGPEAFEGII